VLDRTEQVIAATFYAWLVWRIWPEQFDLAHLAPSLVLVAEGLVLVFLLIRKSTSDVSPRVVDWGVALAGTIVPMLVIRGEDPWLVVPGGIVTLLGFSAQFAAKMSLNRSFGVVPANRGVKTNGAYHFVRHPMYLGYMISHVGFVLMMPFVWNIAVYVVAWGLLVARIRLEERVLSRSEAYKAFQAEVPWRLIPFVY